MSGFGAFGGFGSNTNNSSSSGFGGFGSGNTGGGFGSNTNNTSSPFGASKPTFGSGTTSSGGGLFGSNTATSGSGTFGGFGSTANNTTSTGFGSSNTSGGLFGQNKPAFGGSAGGSLFGGGGTGFGSPNTTNAGFGASAPASTALGGSHVNNGTVGTTWTPITEKDGPTGPNASYQSITYGNNSNLGAFSFEELRYADYNKGAKFGNQNGQPGAFGTGTGFGGFGSSNTGSTGFGASNTNTGGGLFGSNTNTTSFGSNQPQNTSTGFGGFGSTNTNTGGGIFGNKPAGGGLFGNTTTSSGTSSGGLFGTSNTATGGFGSGTSGFGSGNTGGGLFGNQNQNQQNKTGFGFGNTNTGGGFGSGTSTFGNTTNTSTGGGLFGSTTSTSSPFGGNQQQQQNTGSTFGGFGQQNTQQNQNTGGGLFGGSFGSNTQNQQKPGGLFGNTASTTGGGLFGNQTNQQNQSTGGGLFGNTGNQQQGGSLFGNKPASTGTGLFGNTTAQPSTNTGSSIFGGLNTNTQQQNTGGGLFGNTQQNQQKPSLFGSSTTTNTNTGGCLFGNLGQTTNQQPAAGSSLFGGSTTQNQQPQQSSLFGSVNQSQQQQQQPQSLTASLLGSNPYGNDQLFMSLGTPSQSPGPLATPLSSSQKMKKSAIIPQYKVNPAAASRLITPQKKPNGFGFSYSTYGTPGSAIGGGSPYSSSLLGGGTFGRSLGKSFSSSNLRHSFPAEEGGILAPGAFTPSSSRGYNSGSLKKLNIDRNLNTRPALFGDSPNHITNGTSRSPSTGRKSVSFDSSATGGNGAADGTTDNSTALVRTETSPSPGPSENGFSRPSKPQANGITNGGPVKGNELAIVPEDALSSVESDKAAAKKRARMTQKDQIPGPYWSKPSTEELRDMTPQQRRSIRDFEVGRENCGVIVFHQPDLTQVPLEKLFTDVVRLDIRSATVYADDCTERKPPVGQGLNVPSTIVLENSWPRAAAGQLPVFEKRGKKFEKHISRLKRVADTHFKDYNPNTGEWTFTVDHYTRYAFPEDDDDDESVDESTMLSEAPGTPTPATRTPIPRSSAISSSSHDMSMLSPPESSPDDTFDFKKGRPRRSIQSQQESPGVPGGYMEEDEYLQDGQDYAEDSESFLEERSVGSPGDGGEEETAASDYESDSVMDQDMAGSFPVPDHTMELTTAIDLPPTTSVQPKSILKQSTQFGATMGTPSKRPLMEGSDWAEQLQRTVSPKKQDRQALKQSQAQFRKADEDLHEPTPRANDKGKVAFGSTIDIMNSLFNQSTAKLDVSQSDKGRGFEVGPTTLVH